jgi:hypothetical protein
MTSNIKLKQDCKATLNSIRDLLSQDDRQKVEPHLRQILDLTKGLVENAKVSPEEHEALASQVGTLTKERTCLNESIAVLRRDLEKASKLKDEVATLESENEGLDDLLTNVIFGALHQFAANGIGLIAKCGDSGISKWITGRAASNEFDAIERRALLAVCLMVTSVVASEEVISETLAAVCSVSKTNKTILWTDVISSYFKAAGQKEPCQDFGESEWWWLAVNGASVAGCFFPARASELKVTPVPERLIGFRTQAEQLEIQQFLLSASIQDINRYTASLPPKVKAGEVGFVRPSHPEPPQDTTMWSIKRA